MFDGVFKPVQPSGKAAGLFSLDSRYAVLKPEGELEVKAADLERPPQARKRRREAALDGTATVLAPSLPAANDKVFQAGSGHKKSRKEPAPEDSPEAAAPAASGKRKRHKGQSPAPDSSQATGSGPPAAAAPDTKRPGGESQKRLKAAGRQPAGEQPAAGGLLAGAPAEAKADRKRLKAAVKAARASEAAAAGLSGSSVQAAGAAGSGLDTTQAGVAEVSEADGHPSGELLIGCCSATGLSRAGLWLAASLQL